MSGSSKDKDLVGRLGNSDAFGRFMEDENLRTTPGGVLMPVKTMEGEILPPSDKTFVSQLGKYALVNAMIYYHLPDHPKILGEFFLQQLDLAPRFPVLRKFLDFWKREINGPLHSVQVSYSGIVPQIGQPGFVGYLQ